jgi:hypothetical protein
MTEDSFYATIKLVTGEEILAEIIECEENGQDFFLLHNAIIITENNHVDMQKGVVVSGLVPKKWMMYSSDDLQVIYKQHVISVSELDKFGVEFYQKALIAAMASTPIKRRVETKRHSGYVGKIEAFREKLEGMFSDSPDLPKE